MFRAETSLLLGKCCKPFPPLVYLLCVTLNTRAEVMKVRGEAAPQDQLRAPRCGSYLPPPEPGGPAEESGPSRISKVPGRNLQEREGGRDGGCCPLLDRLKHHHHHQGASTLALLIKGNKHKSHSSKKASPCLKRKKKEVICPIYSFKFRFV